MASGLSREMTDQRRALLTERERQILTGEADVTDNYRYSIESRIRTRLSDRFARDVKVIREFYPEMFDELVYPAVCEPAEIDNSEDWTERDQGRDSPDVESVTPITDEGPVGGVTGDGEDTTDTIHQHVRDWLEENPPKKRHAKAAMMDIFAELREEGTVATGDLQERVYPSYSEHYSGARSMWNSLSRYLEDVPGIEKTEYGGWGYAGDEAVIQALDNQE